MCRRPLSQPACNSSLRCVHCRVRAVGAQFRNRWTEAQMHFGAAMFFTDYSMPPGELGAALEARGFESLWAPEHSHIPVSRASPFPNGGELPKQYYDVILRRDGLLRHAVGYRRSNQDAEGWHRRVSRAAARSDPDGEAGGFDRSGVGGAVHVRRRLRLE